MAEAIFLCESKENIDNVYSSVNVDYPYYSSDDIPENGLKGVSSVFSTWGMPVYDEAAIRKLFPDLKYIFYGAGTVQYFARPFLNAGVRIFSAWAANAIPVAEYTVAQIILGNKGFFQSHRRYRSNGFDVARDYSSSFPGNYMDTIGLLGAGMIGRYVIKLLKQYDLSVKVFDPFLSPEEALSLGVEKTGLEDIFSSCGIISNHIANNDKTAGMIGYKLFSLMKDNAVFINTGRGRQLIMEDLLKAMAEKPDRTALLDVTDPVEPLPKDHPAWEAPNVYLTPHIAGSMSQEISRMGEFMIEESQRISTGKKPLYEVTVEMLETMA